MLAVEEHAPTGGREELHRIGDHRHALVEGGAQGLGDVEVPALAYDAHGGGLGLEQGLQRGVDVDLPRRTARRSEGHQISSVERQLGRRPAEELGVLRIRLRVATLDPAHTEPVELLGNAQLVLDRQRDAFELRAVAQRRVEDVDRLGSAGRPAYIGFVLRIGSGVTH